VWHKTRQQQQTSAVQPRHFSMEPESLGLRHYSSYKGDVHWPHQVEDEGKCRMAASESTMITGRDGQAELRSRRQTIDASSESRQRSPAGMARLSCEVDDGHQTVEYHLTVIHQTVH